VGSRTFDGARFAAYTDDHPPDHVHGLYLVPREQMQGLQNATEAQLGHIEIFGGTDITWSDLDVDHNLRSLLVGRYGSEKWMHSLQHRTVSA